MSSLYQHFLLIDIQDLKAIKLERRRNKSSPCCHWRESPAAAAAKRTQLFDNHCQSFSAFKAVYFFLLDKMSASHRSIARLSLEIFTDLRPEQENAESLRCQICTKLKQRGKATEPVTTVGELFKLSTPTLLHTLDPLLTHGEFIIILFLQECIHVIMLSHNFHIVYTTLFFFIVECQELIRRISLHCAPSPTSALDLLHGTNDDSIRYLPTGMHSLDSLLRGGFACGNISELVGRAGVGKSQLALQLCIMAARYNKASIYIDTEQKLSIARLQEMASHRNNHASSLQDASTIQEPFPMVELVRYHHPHDTRRHGYNDDRLLCRRLDHSIQNGSTSACQCHRVYGCQYTRAARSGAKCRRTSTSQTGTSSR